MIGIDTNILAYARISDTPWHDKAKTFLQELAHDTDLVISELVLLEFFLLLRNDKILSPPLYPEEGVRECQYFRAHPRWQLIDSADVMSDVWPIAASIGFSRRRIVDVRLAQTLQAAGVTDFANANVKDFTGVRFQKVWNPLE
jgi:toxin-antitoxin system PIN domain toxin